MNLQQIGTLAALIRNGGIARALGNEMINVPGDAAVDITKDATLLLSKGSAAAITIAAPGADNVGRVITFLTQSDFAHVVTFTGTTLQDGTTGLNTTWTAAAFAGSTLTVRGVSATRWSVVSFNLGTIAP